jgi:hypothetical protein
VPPLGIALFRCATATEGFVPQKSFQRHLSPVSAIMPMTLAACNRDSDLNTSEPQVWIGFASKKPPAAPVSFEKSAVCSVGRLSVQKTDKLDQQIFDKNAIMLPH